MEPQFWSFQCIVFSLFPFFNDDDVCAPKFQPSKKKCFPNPSNEIRNWLVCHVRGFWKMQSLVDDKSAVAR